MSVIVSTPMFAALHFSRSLLTEVFPVPGVPVSPMSMEEEIGFIGVILNAALKNLSAGISVPVPVSIGYSGPHAFTSRESTTDLSRKNGN